MNAWIRLWFAILVAADRLLGTRLAEREAARLQHRINDLEIQAAAIRSQMDRLTHLLHVSRVELCVIYLQQRYLTQPETWLRFAPEKSAEEERDLDILIEQLVQHRLATVHTETVGEQTYVYHVSPDWAAITNLLSQQQEYLNPTTIPWLEEMRKENGKIHH